MLQETEAFFPPVGWWLGCLLDMLLTRLVCSDCLISGLFSLHACLVFVCVCVRACVRVCLVGP